MTEAVVPYRMDGCECGEPLDSAAHRFWCIDGPAGKMRKRPRAPAWRSDLEFIKQVAKIDEEGLRLATKGGYDRGWGQRLRARHDGYLMAIGAARVEFLCHGLERADTIRCARCNTDIGPFICEHCLVPPKDERESDPTNDVQEDG